MSHAQAFVMSEMHQSFLYKIW